MNDASLPRFLSLLIAGASLSLMVVASGGCDGGRPEATDATLAAGEAGAPDDDFYDRDPDSDELSDDAAGDLDDEEPAEDVPPPAPQFTAEQLEQMVAPIALYPDALLMEILMAATYPAEVADAAVWAKEHPGLNGKALDDAIEDKGWDVSVNSLVHAPKALELMAADPQWTRDLGDAFLAQQDDVLNAVQVMRSKACDAGTLKTTEQQEVIIEEAPPRPAEPAPGPVVVAPPPRIVRIVPVQPNVFYVPVYNPRVVFGPPPPVIFYPRAYLYPAITVGVAPVISFGVGLTIGAWLWSDADWYYGRAYRHHHYYDHRRDYYRYGQPPRGDYWWHDHRHRRHVDYRSNDVERYYRSSSRDARREYDRDRDRDRYNDRLRDGRDGDDRRDGRRDGSRDLDRSREMDRDRSGDRARPGDRDRDRAGDRDRTGDRDRMQRDGDRSTGDLRDKAQKESRDKASPATRDRTSPDSKGRMRDDSRGGKPGGKPDDKSSKGPGRIDGGSRGGGPGAPGMSGKGPGSGRPDKGQAVKPDRSPKQGAPSYRPQGGDKRGGSSSQRPPGGGGSSYRPQGGDKRGGSPSHRSPGGGGSSYRPQGGDKRGGSSMQQGGRSGGSSSSRGGGGSSSRGGGQQQRGGSKSQRGGDDGRGGKGGR